jgi:hypothetical protein
MKALTLKALTQRLRNRSTNHAKGRNKGKGHILLLEEEYNCTKIIWLQLPTTTPTPELKG